MDERAAFENFKFKIGDMVEHVATLGERYVVIGRALNETTSGIVKSYILSGDRAIRTAVEIEVSNVPNFE